MKNVKRVLLLLLCLTLFVALIGCGGGGGGTQPSGGDSDGGETNPDEIDLSGVNLTFATGGTTGTYYPFGGAVALMWNEAYDGLNVSVESSGGSKANIISLADDEVDLAIAQSDTTGYMILLVVVSS